MISRVITMVWTMTRASRFRALIRTRLQAVLRRNVRQFSQEELSSSTVIFSPHQDDETLACGGTIIKKLEAGADVSIVFMTNGRGSHPGLIPGDELEQTRKQEALAAAASLGLEGHYLHFYGYEDLRLKEKSEEAVQAVIEVLESTQPESVFIPSPEEKPPDHKATTEIVLSALALSDRHPVVYEYPVWFWQHWPWTPVPYRRRREIPSAWATSVRSGLKLVTDFRHGVYIEDVHERKRNALDEYRSQMTRVVQDPNKRTLADVSNGDFLACFFQEYELFKMRTG